MTRVAIALVVMTATAAANPARDLGDAYRAYEIGDLATAKTKVTRIDETRVANKDYLFWIRGMVLLRTGDPVGAKTSFEKLGQLGGSRYAKEVPWRIADCAWANGDRATAAAAYGKLADGKDGDTGDVGTALWRVAEHTGNVADYRRFVLAHPAHPMAERASEKLEELGAPPITPSERIERSKQLQAAHLWDEAVSELSLLDASRERDYWLGTTLFKMRRRYADAGKLLLGVYKAMNSDEAMFHGARALSRADKDDDAITWYKKVVATYPRSAYAMEAQYLSGWLEFNRGKYKAAIAPLEDTLRRYPKSKWVDDSLWTLGMSHYFLGEWGAARKRLDTLAKSGRSLEGGKGMYWLARIDEKLKNKAAAIEGYTSTVKRFPFSWYALLARARLGALGVKTTPFGIDDAPMRGPKLAAAVDEKLAKDDLIARADELIAAGLDIDAGSELSRGERGFLKRHDRATAFAMLLDRYRKAGNFNRPWMLAEVYGGGAFSGPATDDAKRWWEHAYPRAYRTLVEKYQGVGKNPDGYLFSIMRKESGFDPHILSYADAQGLLQMIPATTRRVAKELKLPYDAGLLYEPEYNIRTASWYIGRLLQKFKGQVPLGAGSFNSGPRPVMKWLDQNGGREMDEFVELVPYTQTREYMKKVTENFARYRYLYGGEVYEQPLVVDKRYLQNQLTY
jgi:soluble lytic murein transglycosylase